VLLDIIALVDIIVLLDIMALVDIIVPLDIIVLVTLRSGDFFFKINLEQESPG
jgi:hypothetical protein